MILIQIDTYASVQIYKRVLNDRLQPFFSLSLLSFCSIYFTFYTNFHAPYYLPIYTAKALFNIFSFLYLDRRWKHSKLFYLDWNINSFFFSIEKSYVMYKNPPFTGLTESSLMLYFRFPSNRAQIFLSTHIQILSHTKSNSFKWYMKLNIVFTLEFTPHEMDCVCSHTLKERIHEHF